MAGRMSAATERALARIAAGSTGYAAAKAEGINLTTIYKSPGYRAAVQAREALKRKPARGASKKASKKR